MTPLTWKAAITGGALLGLGVGGFTMADDGDSERQPVDSVKLRQASVDAARLSAPVTVAPATTVAAAVDPAPIAAPTTVAPTTAAPAPAPAPAAADSTHTPDTPAPPAAPQPASVDSPASPPDPAPDSPGTGAS